MFFGDTTMETLDQTAMELIEAKVAFHCLFWIYFLEKVVLQPTYYVNWGIPYFVTLAEGFALWKVCYTADPELVCRREVATLIVSASLCVGAFFGTACQRVWQRLSMPFFHMKFTSLSILDKLDRNVPDKPLESEYLDCLYFVLTSVKMWDSKSADYKRTKEIYYRLCSRANRDLLMHDYPIIDPSRQIVGGGYKK